MAPQIKLPLATLASHVRVPVQVPATVLLIQLPAHKPGKAANHGQVLRPPSPTWEMWRELRAPGFGLVQPLQPNRESINEQRSFCISPPLSVTLPLFIKKLFPSKRTSVQLFTSRSCSDYWLFPNTRPLSWIESPHTKSLYL